MPGCRLLLHRTPYLLARKDRQGGSKGGKGGVPSDMPGTDFGIDWPTEWLNQRDG